MEGGDSRAAVWWDLNSSPVPDGVEPGRVRGCIESAMYKVMGCRSQVTIFAFGNLEFTSSALLEEIYSSGIFLTHAPCGWSSIGCLLSEWYKPPGDTVMVISCDYTIVNSSIIYSVRPSCLYFASPEYYPAPICSHNAYAKKFVWETLLKDNMTTTCGEIVNQPPPPPPPPALCSCDICYETFQICAEFITHLKSEEHIEKLFKIVPRLDYNEVKFFCQVCKYPAYNDYNLFLHEESEEHIRKAEKMVQDESRKSEEPIRKAEKMAQDEDLRESRKRNPQVDLVNEANKKQSFEVA